MGELIDPAKEELFDPAPADLATAKPIRGAEDILALMEAKAMKLQVAGAQAANQHPEVNTQLTDGPGVYGYYSSTKRWGRRQTVDALREVGDIWAARFPGRSYGVGDISLQGGGDIDGHASHELGIDVDTRLIRLDWEKSHTTWQSSNYSRKRTQQLINLMWANSHAPVKLILFNDPQTKGRQEYPNHDNHLHVRFQPVAAASGHPRLVRGNGMAAANNELQYALNAWHVVNAHAGSKLVVDGDFGGLTETRLRQFQATSASMTVNGITDAPTWAALLRWRREPFQDAFLA